MSQIQTLYKNHFGMTGRPFSALADGKTFHWGPAHMRGLAALEFGLISFAPFTVLTGASGSGKTSMILNVMQNAQKDLHFALVMGLRRGGGSILPWILQALGETVDGSEGEAAMFTRIQDFLVGEYGEARRVALVFDEAHNLSPEALDELRVLSNINTAQDQLIQVVLVGQPQLRTRLSAPEMSGFAQRVSAWGHIDPIDRSALTKYVATRLAASDAPEDLFTVEALDLIHEASMGLPRSINQLCELTLVYAMTGQVNVIKRAAVAQVLSDGLFLRPQKSLLARPGQPGPKGE